MKPSIVTLCMTILSLAPIAVVAILAATLGKVK